jgi:hypothetical protein
LTIILDTALADGFARLTLFHLTQEYPNKLDHVLTGPEDAATPSQLHPVFYGSFDWHSCVHGWWQVLRLRRLFPHMAQAGAIRAAADAMLVPGKLAGELAYLTRPSAQGFERPYGWAWMLALHDEAERHGDAGWGDALAPLANEFAERLRNFLPKLTYPIRHGIHSNTAFALVLAHDWAKTRDLPLLRLIADRSKAWFTDDQNCQAWEPSGDEFLSPALTEALLMSRVLAADDFAGWFDAFLPHIGKGEPETLFRPAVVSDRSDGKIAHLDGLNLSRTWCWRDIAARLPDADPVRSVVSAAAQRHLAATLPHIAGDYMGEHWLATFALLALAEPTSG